jgi:hypothetical protein
LNGSRYESRILRMGDTAQSTLFSGLAIPLEVIFA